jgi:ABC-type sugar transport system ATPase subunit
VLAIEQQLTRVQTELDSQIGQFKNLSSQVALSRLEIDYRRGQVLGPLGLIGYGIYWVFEKLFVIRD